MKDERTLGIIAGCFDVIHAGYIEAFNEIKQKCDLLYVLLHIDPSIENIKKNKPIFEFNDRFFILKHIKEVDGVFIYNKEKDLEKWLEILSNQFNCTMFLGDDHKNDEYTGKNLNIPVVFLNRTHGWSATKYKRMIYEQIAKQHTI